MFLVEELLGQAETDHAAADNYNSHWLVPHHIQKISAAQAEW
jgi:hypothetical protein